MFNPLHALIPISCGALPPVPQIQQAASPFKEVLCEKHRQEALRLLHLFPCHVDTNGLTLCACTAGFFALDVFRFNRQNLFPILRKEPLCRLCEAGWPFLFGAPFSKFGVWSP